MTNGAERNELQIANNAVLRRTLRQVAVLAVFFAPGIGFCDASAESVSDGAMQRAFEEGQGEVPTTKPPYLLEITRYGHHLALTGYDRSGASAARLTCLLCTNQEALAAAAHLGDCLGRQYRGEAPKTVGGVPPNATLSANGLPVTPLPQTKSPSGAAVVPQDTALRFRWGIAAAALGASAIVIGGIFMWLDGKCADEACTGIQHLKGAGIGLVVSGALLETGGLLLMLLKRSRTVQQ